MSAIPLTHLGRMALGLLLASPGHTAGEKLNEELLLRAIAQVESGTTNLSRPFKKVGSAGERGAWQMKQMVWRQYTRAPFAQASTDAVLANLIAALHLKELCRKMEADKVKPTAYFVALQWNSSDAQYDYATRVNNVYHALAEAIP